MFKIHPGENLESKWHFYGFLSVIADILYCTCVFVEHFKKIYKNELSMRWHSGHFGTLVSQFIPKILISSLNIADLK